MRTTSPLVFQPLVLLALLSGCAATSVSSRRDGGSGAAADSILVVELDLRRSAQLTDTRGTLRVLDQDLRVEYRRGGRGPGLDAGAVTLDGRPLRRQVGKSGVSYRLGRDEPEGGTQASDEPWRTLANEGGPDVARASARVKLAPFPVITQPTPGQTVLRTEELAVVMLPPVSDVWYRVSLVGVGDAVTATDLGQGRWLFPRGSLQTVSQGQARILIDVETSCGACDVAEGLRASWSTRSGLEVPVTML